jgi:hypothetical protein
VEVNCVQTAHSATAGAILRQVFQGGTRRYHGFGEGSEMTMLEEVSLVGEVGLGGPTEPR